MELTTIRRRLPIAIMLALSLVLSLPLLAFIPIGTLALAVQETVTAPFANGPNGVTTTNSYFGSVSINVSGSGQAAGTARSDAFYVFTDGSGNPIPEEHHADFGLCINFQPVDKYLAMIPPFRSSHTYQFTIFLGSTPQQLTFGVCDTFTADNTGSFAITVTTEPAKQQFINAFADLQVTFDPITPPFQKIREQLEKELTIATNMINAARQISGITEQRSFQIAVGTLIRVGAGAISAICRLTGRTCQPPTLRVPLCNLPICFLDGNVKFFKASSFQLFSFNISAQVEKSTLAFVHPGDRMVTDAPFFGIEPSFSIVEVENTAEFPEFGIIDFKIEGVSIDPEPFTAFDVEAEIKGSTFEVEGSFILGNESNGINALTENVALQVGTFFTMIPTGSFMRHEEGAVKFEGEIDGVELEVMITPHAGNNFDVKIEGAGANLKGTANPVDVKLVIGDDAGSVRVIAELKRGGGR